MSSSKERCQLCGKDTEYDIGINIIFRRHYVEGAGQLCPKCYNITYPKSEIACDICGKVGAFDFNNDFLCSDCVVHEK